MWLGAHGGGSYTFRALLVVLPPGVPVLRAHGELVAGDCHSIDW